MWPGRPCSILGLQDGCTGMRRDKPCRTAAPVQLGICQINYFPRLLILRLQHFIADAELLERAIELLMHKMEHLKGFCIH